MSSSVTVRPVRGVRGIGLTAIIVGIVMILAGGTTWGMVASQLDDEQITVSSDAQFLAGQRVNGPLTAYAQAEVINKHALEASGGKTFAQIPQDDPVRATVMNGSFLRASLFTSVVAFGVALLVVGCGVLFLLIGIALRKLGRGDVTVLGVVPAAATGGDATIAPTPPSGEPSVGRSTSSAPRHAPVAPPVSEAPAATPAEPPAAPPVVGTQDTPPAETVEPVREETEDVSSTSPDAADAADAGDERPPSA